ncbi:MAG TPA: hypothetical protein VGI78_11570 [Acetobacteraceae bacterium]|jgi:hypothetical protein
MRKIICCVMVALVEQACAQQAPPDLSAALKGIDKTKFLACSGPPSLDLPRAGQDRMSFVTNLRRGSTIGITSPTVAPAESCSVDAVFEQDRLVSSVFSGNLAMCQLVFAPCLQK